ncbi:MAG TPA: glycosyltransferase family 2 protein [Bryobacteraceae bacterium]|jgi:glycosyltransferase involved in cell wall biosynthesis|nr:glycosyltransferase family 2 protein [Bryobacteraceae bacterium]
MKISATIIASNEERNLPRAIESLRCCDEIVVVDSGSADRTVEIAANLGARVIEAPWRGYAAQKNFASECASHDWILSIDADEALSEALESEIWQIKRNGPAYDAYTMPRLAQYLGRWIFHSGWYPDRKVRLFDRRRAQWQGEFVHESVKVHGTIGHLQANLLHFTCSSLSEHLKTMDSYTTLAAEQLIAEGRRAPWSRLVLDPPWTFFQTYVLKRGFLDGLEGLAIAHMAALYNFLKYAKARYMTPGRH